LLEGFPFPHELRIDTNLREGTLTIRTSLTPTGNMAVPISFGFHPYLTLPGLERADWHVELPVGTRLITDDRHIPTGETEPADVEPGPLGERAFDDSYTDLAAPARF